MAKWIAISGMDGSGKTGLVTSLEAWLKKEGYKVKRSRLPYVKFIVNNLLDKSKSKRLDRMLFAVDNMFFAQKMVKWGKKYDFVITQRCYIDTFVHGNVQGFSNEELAIMNNLKELPKEDIVITLNCEAKEAYSRIKDDPTADKFEYLDYMQTQSEFTKKIYDEIVNQSDETLKHFSDAKHMYIDTTEMSVKDTYKKAKAFLKEVL